MLYTTGGIMLASSSRGDREDMMVEQLQLKVPHPMLVFLVFVGFVLPVAKAFILRDQRFKGDAFGPLLALCLATGAAIWWAEGVSELFILVFLSSTVGLMTDEFRVMDAKARARNRVARQVYLRSLKRYESDLAGDVAAAGEGEGGSGSEGGPSVVERAMQARPAPAKPRRHFTGRVWASTALGLLLFSPFIGFAAMTSYDPEFPLRKDVRRHPALRVMKRVLGADRKPLDPWAVVGVDKDAEDSQVRSAFRRKALKLHPDKNPENREEAQRQFELLQRAYDILTKKSERRKFLEKTRNGELSQLVGRTTLLSMHIGMTIVSAVLGYVISAVLAAAALVYAFLKKMAGRGVSRGGGGSAGGYRDGQLDPDSPFTKEEEEEASLSAELSFEILLHRPAVLQLLEHTIQRRESLDRLLRKYGRRLQSQARQRFKSRLREEQGLAQSLEARMLGGAAQAAEQTRVKHVEFLDQFESVSHRGMEHISMGNLWNDSQVTRIANEARMAACAMSMLDVYQGRGGTVPEAVGRAQADAQRVYEKSRRFLDEYQFHDTDMGLRLASSLDDAANGQMSRTLVQHVEASLERSEHREFNQRCIGFFCEMAGCESPFKFRKRLPPAPAPARKKEQ